MNELEQERAQHALTIDVLEQTRRERDSLREQLLAAQRRLGEAYVDGYMYGHTSPNKWPRESLREAAESIARDYVAAITTQESEK